MTNLYKLFPKIATGVLLAATFAVLIENFHYLFTAPIANTIWWCGDETWLMSQYKEFLVSGHYINPLAPGSAYAHSSGLIFGSCYLTMAVYGLPLFFIKGHTIETGRMVTWLFSIGTIVVLWIIAKRYRVPPMLRAFGCLLLAATPCFFITSHSARSDMLIGLAELILIGYLPFLVGSSNRNTDIYVGLLIPASLLINGHIAILSCFLFCYVAWDAGVMKQRQTFLRWVGSATLGLAVLLMLQWVLLGSLSITGPFTANTSSMPFARLLHPRAHLTNFDWRLFIIQEWAPGVLGVAILVIAGLIWAKYHHGIALWKIPSTQRRLIISTVLVVFSSVFIEYYWPRCLIYVLPVIVLNFIIIITALLSALPRTTVTIIALGLCASLFFGMNQYWQTTSQLGTSGEVLTAADDSAVSAALAEIHRRHEGNVRVFASIAGIAKAMDDSCQLLTSVMYQFPANRTESRDTIWKRANVDYAIICKLAHPGRAGEQDTSIDWFVKPSSRMIFERTGPFSDIDRPYDTSNLKFLDTLRVYEFK